MQIVNLFFFTFIPWSMCIGTCLAVKEQDIIHPMNKNERTKIKKGKKGREKENKILMLHGTGKEINKNLFFS